MLYFSNKNRAIFFVFVLFFINVSFVFAGNPASPIEPGDNIQDPGDPGTPWGGCGPTDSNCYVTTPSSGAVFSAITPATSTNTINNANYTQEWQWNTLSGSGLKLTSNSTAASGNAQKLFEVALSGANALSSQTTYASSFTNTHTGSGTNVGLYATATGGTNNYAAIFESGTVGIGTTTPDTSFALDVDGKLHINDRLYIGPLPENYAPARINISSFATKNTFANQVFSLSSTETGSPTYPTQLIFAQEGASVGWSLSSVNQGVEYTPILLNPYGGEVIIGTQANNDLGIFQVSGDAWFSSALVIEGSNDGTDALTLTSGDILLSNGDFDLSGGDWNITLDGTDDALINKIATGTSAEEGLEIVFNATTGNNVDQRALVIDVASTNHNASTDLVIGLDIEGLASADAEGIETAIRVGTGWDYGAIFESGNVGIGDTSPASLFTVGSGDLFQVNSSGNVLGVFANATTDTDRFLVSDSGTIKYRTGSELRSDIAAAGISGTPVANQIAFWDGASTAMGSTAFTVSDALYPSLQIGGTGDQSATLLLRDAAGTTAAVSGDSGGLTLYGSSTYKGQTFYANAGGNLLAQWQDLSGTLTHNFKGRISTDTLQTGGSNLGAYNIDRTFPEAVSGNNQHGYVDKTVFRYGGSAAFNAFYAENTIGATNGAYTQDHWAGFQTRITKDGANTVNNLYDFVALGSLINGGTTTNRYGFYMFSADNAGGGTLTNQYGIYIPTLSDATNNYGAYFADNIGVGTDTTPDYLIDIENTGTDTDIFALTDSDGACLYNPESGSVTVSCSSDERLKENIVDAPSSLEYFNSFIVRQYNVIASGDLMTGVIAQEVLQTHPELVTLGVDGMYSVQLPNQWKFVKAIQELDIATESIANLIEGENSFVGKLRTWLADINNGINKIFAKKVETEELCLKKSDGTQLCLNGDQLQQILGGSTSTPSSSEPNDLPSPENIPTEEVVPTEPPQPEETPPVVEEVPVETLVE